MVKLPLCLRAEIVVVDIQDGQMMEEQSQNLLLPFRIFSDA
jgi:hypothetical protein